MEPLESICVHGLQRSIRIILCRVTPSLQFAPKALLLHTTRFGSRCGHFSTHCSLVYFQTQCFCVISLSLSCRVAFVRWISVSFCDLPCPWSEIGVCFQVNFICGVNRPALLCPLSPLRLRFCDSPFLRTQTSQIQVAFLSLFPHSSKYNHNTQSDCPTSNTVVGIMRLCFFCVIL
jgi:hypothetical protein